MKNFITQLGIIIFAIMFVLAIVLNIFQPKWYWKTFIPKLQDKEEKHPVITGTLLLLLIIIILVGIMNIIR